MLRTGWNILLSTWLLRRVLVLGMLVSGLFTVPSHQRVEWIAVLGGGGGARLEKAVALQSEHPGATILVVGSGPELAFANQTLARLGAADPHLLVVEPGTTRACVAALKPLSPAHGLIVTHRAHAPRVRLTWLLEGLSSVPRVVSASDEPVPHEWLKAVGYLLRY